MALSPPHPRFGTGGGLGFKSPTELPCEVWGIWMWKPLSIHRNISTLFVHMPVERCLMEITHVRLGD